MIQGLLRLITVLEVIRFFKWVKDHTTVETAKEKSNEDNTELSKVPQNTRASKE